MIYAGSNPGFSTWLDGGGIDMEVSQDQSQFPANKPVLPFILA